MVIDGFTLARTADPVGLALGVGDKHEAAAAGRGRRGRRRAAVEEKKEDAEPKNGLVTDPVLDAPFTVTMALSVYDFKTMEDESKTEEVEK